MMLNLYFSNKLIVTTYVFYQLLEQLRISRKIMVFMEEIMDMKKNYIMKEKNYIMKEKKLHYEGKKCSMKRSQDYSNYYYHA
jgi:hypothetical protein